MDEAYESAQLVLREPLNDIHEDEEFNGIEDSDDNLLTDGVLEEHSRLRSSSKRKRAGLGIQDGHMFAMHEDDRVEYGGGRFNGLLPRANDIYGSRRSSGSRNHNVRFAEDEMETPATLLAVDDTSDPSDDEDYDPGRNTHKSTLLGKENVTPHINGFREAGSALLSA